MTIGIITDIYYFEGFRDQRAPDRTPPQTILLQRIVAFTLHICRASFSLTSFIYRPIHCRRVYSPMRLGAMATLGDHKVISALPVDFIELLVLPGDDLERLAMFCDDFDGELILHAPEELPDGRFLDLASPDETVRTDSVRRIRDVAKAGRETARPVVVHPGGITDVPIEDTARLVTNLRSSLDLLPDYLWLENMPRHYHYKGMLKRSNLMRVPSELREVEDLVAGFTVDVSHAYLGVDGDGNANVMGMFKELGEAVRHVHLSDAKRPDVEGVMIGDGELRMDFLPYLRGLPVLLEIWGGHLENGAGFREALQRMRGERSIQQTQRSP
jgi:sugar phosphate isomerase/epimerase